MRAKNDPNRLVRKDYRKKKTVAGDPWLADIPSELKAPPKPKTRTKGEKVVEEFVAQLDELKERADRLMLNSLDLLKKTAMADSIRTDEFGNIFVMCSEVEVQLPPMPPASEFLNYDEPDPLKQKFRRVEEPEGFMRAYLDMEARQDEWNKANADLDKEAFEYNETDLWVWKFIEQEFDRRRNGVWFFNKGVPVYLTGNHYFFLNYYTLKSGLYPNFRDTDWKFFLFLDWAIKNPNVKGVLVMENRQTGKSAKGGSTALNITSMIRDGSCYIQSRNEDLAKEFFSQAIVTAWNHLSVWMKPNVEGYTASSLTFKSTDIKKGIGNQNIVVDPKASLNSFIECAKSGDVDALNGKTQMLHVGDEWGSTPKVNILKRHDTNKESSRFMYYMTTVQDMEGRESLERVQTMWYGSDPKQLEEFGFTETGLVRYFKPAFHGLQKLEDTPPLNFVDEWGNSMEKEAFEHLTKYRMRLKDQPDKLIQFMRFHPFTPEEAMSPSTDDCPFDVAALVDRHQVLDQLKREKKNYDSYGAPMYVAGDLEWTAGFKSAVRFVPRKEGRFLISRLPTSPNNVKLLSDSWGDSYLVPCNKDTVQGVDPFDFRNAVSAANKLSKGAGMIFHRDKSSDDPLDGRIECVYNARPDNYVFYEDMAKMAWYYGCQIVAESNKENFINYLVDNGLGMFLKNKLNPVATGVMRGKAAEAKGEYTGAETLQKGTEDIQAYVSRHAYKIDFPILIEQLLRWSIKDSNKYDLVVAFIMCMRGVTLKEAKESIDSELDEGDNDEIISNFARSLSEFGLY